MQIGTLYQVGDEIRGELRTLTVLARVAFIPVPASKGAWRHRMSSRRTGWRSARLGRQPRGPGPCSRFAFTIRGSLCRRSPHWLNRARESACWYGSEACGAGDRAAAGR